MFVFKRGTSDIASDRLHYRDAIEHNLLQWARIRTSSFVSISASLANAVGDEQMDGRSVSSSTK